MRIPMSGSMADRSAPRFRATVAQLPHVRLHVSAREREMMPRVVIAFGEQAGESQAANAAHGVRVIGLLRRDREAHATRNLAGRGMIGWTLSEHVRVVRQHAPDRLDRAAAA